MPSTPVANSPSTPALLSAYERCARRGYKLSHLDYPARILITDAVERSVRAAWMSNAADPGLVARDMFMELAREPGLAQADTPNLYATALNHACIAELIATLVRKPQDRPCRELPPEIISWADGSKMDDVWRPHALLDASGSHLRRFLAVSRWSHERHVYETRSWFGLGETAYWRMPMQLVVAVLGPLIGGRRYGPWARGWYHGSFRKLRFQKKHNRYQPFQGKWMPVWREDQEAVSRSEWLQAMLDDQILPDVLFVIDIPVPSESQRQEIISLARRKLFGLSLDRKIPDVQFTACYDLISACPFIGDCHGALPTARRITGETVGDETVDVMAGIHDRTGVTRSPPRFGRPLS